MTATKTGAVECAVFGTLTTRNPENVRESLWTETGRWVAAEDYERLQRENEYWKSRCFRLRNMVYFGTTVEMRDGDLDEIL